MAPAPAPAPPPPPPPAAAPTPSAASSRNEDLDSEIKAQVEQVVRTEVEELRVLQVSIAQLSATDQMDEYHEACEEYTKRNRELAALQDLVAKGQYEAAAQRVLQTMENSGMGHDKDDYSELPKPKVLGFEETIAVCRGEMLEWRQYFKS